MATQIAFQLTKSYGASFRSVSAADHQAGGRRRCGWRSAGSRLVDGLDRRSRTTGIVTFAVAPAVGAAVTAGFVFDVPVRFDTDRLDVELSSFDAADAPNIPLIEVLT